MGFLRFRLANRTEIEKGNRKGILSRWVLRLPLAENIKSNQGRRQEHILLVITEDFLTRQWGEISVPFDTAELFSVAGGVSQRKPRWATFPSSSDGMVPSVLLGIYVSSEFF